MSSYFLSFCCAADEITGAGANRELLDCFTYSPTDGVVPPRSRVTVQVGINTEDIVDLSQVRPAPVIRVRLLHRCVPDRYVGMDGRTVQYVFNNELLQPINFGSVFVNATAAARVLLENTTQEPVAYRLRFRDAAFSVRPVVEDEFEDADEAARAAQAKAAKAKRRARARRGRAKTQEEEAEEKQEALVRENLKQQREAAARRAAAELEQGVILVGQTLEVPLQFFPKHEFAYHSTLEVHTRKGVFRVELSGTGAHPNFNVSATRFDFGAVGCAHPVAKTLVVSNTCGSTLTFDAVNIPEGFRVSPRRTELAPYSDTRVRVTFAPKEKGVVYQGIVGLCANARPCEDLRLIGTGGTVGLSVSDTLQLGTVPVKLSQRAPLLLLHNTGDVPLALRITDDRGTDFSIRTGPGALVLGLRAPPRKKKKKKLKRRATQAAQTARWRQQAAAKRRGKLARGWPPREEDADDGDGDGGDGATDTRRSLPARVGGEDGDGDAAAKEAKAAEAECVDVVAQPAFLHLLPRKSQSVLLTMRLNREGELEYPLVVRLEGTVTTPCPAWRVSVVGFGDKIKFSDTLLNILGTEHLEGAEVEELPNDERHFKRALKHRDRVRAVDTGHVVALVAPTTAEDLAHVTGKPPALCAGVDDVAFRRWFHAQRPVAPPLGGVDDGAAAAGGAGADPGAGGAGKPKPLTVDKAKLAARRMNGVLYRRRQRAYYQWAHAQEARHREGRQRQERLASLPRRAPGTPPLHHERRARAAAPVHAHLAALPAAAPPLSEFASLAGLREQLGAQGYGGAASPARTMKKKEEEEKGRWQ